MMSFLLKAQFAKKWLVGGGGARPVVGGPDKARGPLILQDKAIPKGIYFTLFSHWPSWISIPVPTVSYTVATPWLHLSIRNLIYLFRFTKWNGKSLLNLL